MGCGSSSAVAVDNTTTTTYPKKPLNGRDKASEKFTLKEWSEQLCSASSSGPSKYSQSSLPDHYTEEEIEFYSEAITEDEWKIAINVDLLAKPASIESINWPYKKTAAKYNEPSNCLAVQINMAADSDRREILAVGGAYIGCNSCEFEQLFAQLSLQSVHSIVFCGNIFDLLGMEPFHETPSDISQLITKLDSKDTLLAALRMIATKDVKVYYLSGSFDAQLPVVAVEKYLGSDIVHVQEESLVLSVNHGSKDCYRVRFTSGSQWDLLNYSDLPDNQLVCGRPIGYYLARSAAQNSEFSSTNLITPLVRGIPASQEKVIIEFITKQPLHRQVTQQLLSAATGLTVEELLQIKCIIAQAKYINATTLLDYPFLKFIFNKVGKEQILVMLKAMSGDYSSALSHCQEDVVISGLNDNCNLQKVKGESGDILVGCPGSLKLQEPQAVRVTFPKLGINGKVELVPILQIPKSETPKPGNGTEPAKVVDNPDNTLDDSLNIEDL